MGTEYTVFIVGKRDSNESGNWFIGGSDIVANKNLHVGYATNTELRCNQFSNNITVSVDGYSADPLSVFTFNLDTSVGRKIWKDSVEIGSNSDKNTLSEYADASIARYLAEYGAVTISEILIYKTALSDLNRNTVEDYLTNKWGL